MRVSFTSKQIGAVGELPFIRREGEYNFALKATSSVEIPLIDKNSALAELKDIKTLLTNGLLHWQCSKGFHLDVQERKIHTALLAYALRAKLGRIYCVKLNGLTELMRIFHKWRYSGVEIAAVDDALSDYGVNDIVPFSVFKGTIDALWVENSSKERIIFQDSDGWPVSIYNTPVGLKTSMVEAIAESIKLSAYETMCCHVITSMLEIPRSVSLLGINEDSCFVLDTTGRNENDIVRVFSSLVFPHRYFARLIGFSGDVKLIEENIISHKVV